MKVRLENGFGQPVGLIDLPAAAVKGLEEGATSVTICWRYRSPNSSVKLASLTLPVGRCIPWGWHVQAHSKERARLERAGLIMPYEKIERYDLERNCWHK